MKLPMLRTSVFIVVLLAFPGICRSQTISGYPDGVTETQYRSEADETMQPALVWFPETDQPVPLLVALHTWSSDYRQAGGEAQYARWCQQAGWAFVHPNFRGINKTPDAMGSDLAVADIRSAVAFAQSETNIDAKRVYCIGVSGGGHASLLMAARHPRLWAGVSAWCGISDIAAWHQQCADGPFKRYAGMIETVLNGNPTQDEQVRQTAWHRSPLKWIRETDALPPLDINHGINDGRTGSVPFTQSIHAFNAAVNAPQKISQADLETFYQTQKVPESLEVLNEAEQDDLYGDHQPVFRITAGTTRLTIFQGGHEIVHRAALNWLAAQTQGHPVEWHPPLAVELDVAEPDTQSGK